MKRVIPFLLILLSVFVFAGCKEETTIATTEQPVTTLAPTTAASTSTASPVSTVDPNQALIDTVYDWLTLGDISALVSTSPRLILPTSRTGVTITWDIDPEGYIAANGVITQPDHETGTQEVTLTATLTVGSFERTKIFTATVIALTAPEDNPPIMNETFNDYADGNIATQMETVGIWAPVSGKTSTTSLFSVVSEVGGNPIPSGSKALEIRSHLENQIIGPLFHTFDKIVIEADVYQTANGSPIYLQTSQSTPAIGFGLSGAGSTASIYYRTDNGLEIKTQIQLNTWYKIRLEADVLNNTIEFFYYDADGHLIPCTSEPVTYSLGDGGFVALYIRSGSSTTPAQQSPAYITNIVVNRIEALPKPDDPVKLGSITGIETIEVIENGGTFTPADPVVKGYYGAQDILVKDTDYTLVVTNPVDTDVNGNYTVIYEICNIHNPLDVKTVTQTVVIYAPGDPNVIDNVSSTIAHALTHETDLTVTAQRAEGVLHYVVSATVLTAEQVTASPLKVSIPISDLATVIEGVVVDEGEKVYLVIELNGLSNLIEHEVTIQELVPISTVEEFFTTFSVNLDTGKYYILENDLDFQGFAWTVSTTNKLYDTLDGQGHTIRNLIINKTGIRGGIFSDLENATIRNIVFDNVATTSNASASALLAGEARGIVLIENIVVINSSNTVAEGYNALLVGRLRNSVQPAILTIRNTAVINTTVNTSVNKYGGGLVATMDTNTVAMFSDIYLDGFTCSESVDMLGGVIGRVQGDTTIERVYINNLNMVGVKNVGGLIGKSDEVGVDVLLKDIYINGTITFVPIENHNNILVGNISDHTPVVENAWASGFETVGELGLGVLPESHIDHSLTEVESWWTTNIPTILASDLWEFVTDRPMLKIVPQTE